MKHSHSIRTMLLLLGALAFPFLAPPAMSASETIILPFNDRGEISIKQLAQAILDAQDSRIRAPERLANMKVPMNSGLGRWTVVGWNLVLGNYGLHLEQHARALHIQVDKERVQARRRDLSQWLATTFGIEPQAPNLLPLAGEDNKGPTVVLVHGVDSGAARFKGTAAKLAARDYRVLAFEYPNDGAIGPNAKSLSDTLQALPADARKGLSLVGVSMGALLIREVLENPALPHPPIARFVACAPPFKGSELARYRAFMSTPHALKSLKDGKWAGLGIFDGLGFGSNDLLPDSDFLATANRRPRNPDVDYAILAGNRAILRHMTIRNLEATVDKVGNTVNATRDYLHGALNALEATSGGHGDGAVRIASTRLPGVEDHVVLPFNHLEILAGDEDEANIPGLRELLERLPK